MSSAQPRFGYTTPPETFKIPRGLKSFEPSEARREEILKTPGVYRCADYANPLTGLTGPSPKEPSAASQRTNQVGRGSALPTEESSMPKTDESKREKYKAARMRGLDREAAGQAAGYRWSTRAIAGMCGLKLDRQLGIEKSTSKPVRPLGAAPVTRPAPAIRTAPVRKRTTPAHGLPADDHISKAIADLRARRDRLDEAIATLEKLFA